MLGATGMEEHPTMLRRSNMAAELKPLYLAGAFLLCTYSRRTWVCRAPPFPAEKHLPQSFSFSQYPASASPSLQEISSQQLLLWTLT